MKLMKCLMMTKMHIQTLIRVIQNQSSDRLDRTINLIELIVSMKNSIDMLEEVEQSLVLDLALILAFILAFGFWLHILFWIWHRFLISAVSFFGFAVV